jgi:transcriptional regulator with XRE-family HTH domain
VNLNNKRQKLAKKLTNKEYRDAWVDESVKSIVPYQIQAIRKQRGWSQAFLGEKAGMLPNAVTRLESVAYGNLSINTLLRIAHSFDCGLLVKFVPFSRLVGEFEDVSPNALEVDSFHDDFGGLMSWADEIEQDSKFEVKSELTTEYPTEKPLYAENFIRGSYSFDIIQANPTYVS